MQRVGIVDYRMGNLASVAKALENVGAESFVSGDRDALAASDIVVLPGVGNFAAGMANLRRVGLDAFASAVLAGNVIGVQFHPEKSSLVGLALLAAALQTFSA